MALIHVVIPAEPFAKEAPRTAIYKGRAIIYKSSATSVYMKSAAMFMFAARSKHGIFAPLDGPLRVQVFAFSGNVPGRLLKQHDTGVLIRKTTKPDMDNILKVIGDAGNRVLWNDDAQITEWSASKWYAQKGSPARVEILVDRVDDHVISA